MRDEFLIAVQPGVKQSTITSEGEIEAESTYTILLHHIRRSITSNLAI